MSYWLGIMAIALAAAIALWIWLVFRAARREPEDALDSSPHREVIGGGFVARSGGRQVMPDPREPIVPERGTDRPGSESGRE